jgi:murein DD-endopeptidase MepM/ murein hydrolase activator NlpD
MHRHAIPEPGRATWFAVVVTAAVAVSIVGPVGAFSTIDDAGVSAATAERVVTTGEGLLFPVEPYPVCIVGNNFGGDSKVFGSGGHQGVDIAAAHWQEVYAVEDGSLYRRFEGGSSGLGWGLWSVTDVKYRYFHLAALAPGLAEADHVSEGQLIGYVGDTGNAAPGGYHLHFEARPAPDYLPVDPVPLLDIPTICTVYG